MSPPQRLEYVTVDVFTQDRYAGNPLAVVKIPNGIDLSTEHMQKIANEFNYSETVILHENSAGKAAWDIRIFLTDAEVPLAGHPIIGTACVLARTTGFNEGVMQTRAGPVSYKYSVESKTAQVEIPHDVFVHPVTFTKDLALQHNVPESVVESMVGPAAIVSIVKGMTFCLIELSSLHALGQVNTNMKEPKIDGLNQEYAGLLGMMFFVREDDAGGMTKLRTRMFIGPFEDPATGSASCALTAYLAVHDRRRPNRENGQFEFELTQAVEMNRKSVIGVKIHGDRDTQTVTRVLLKGSAVEVMVGSLVPPQQLRRLEPVTSKL